MVVVDRLICDDGTRWGRSRSHSGGRHATSGADDAPSLSLAREDIRLLCEKVGHVRNARGGNAV